MNATRLPRPSWPDHTIWWHVYPLGFADAPVRPAEHERGLAHRLRRVTAWLDHAVALGANGLLLGPIFAAETHGYDTTDHLTVDPRLGDDADVDDLIAEASRRGVRVVLDGVFNQVGLAHPAFQRALAGPDAPEGALFHLDWSTGQPTHATFEGHGSLAALNHANPAVADLVVDVMLHWLRRGIAGWRLDAAYAVPTGFWAEVIARVRAEFPDAWFLGEVIHGDYAGFVTASGVDTVTQYELWKATWSSLKDANFFELAHALGRHNDLLGTFTPQTFIGNHDTTRIATMVGPEKAALALVVLLTTAGVPSLYYGDEWGLTGLKTETWGGDDAVRQGVPDTPEQVDAAGQPTLALHRELVALRRRHPWLVRATTETVELTNERYVYDSVGAAGERLRVALDLHQTPSFTISDPFGTVLASR